MKQIILIALTILSFFMENRITSALSEAAAPFARSWSVATAPLNQPLQTIKRNVSYSLANPQYVYYSGVASVRQASARLDALGLPRLQPVKAL